MDTWEAMHTFVASELDKECNSGREGPIVDRRSLVNGFDYHVRCHGRHGRCVESDDHTVEESASKRT